MSQFEDDLRKALGECATEVPEDLAARLRRIDYRPRSRRLGAALTAGGVLCAAAMAGVVVSIVGLGAGTQPAFAGWSASPTVPASGQTATAEAACLARVPSASDVERARDDGTAHEPVMEALLKIAPDEWRPVLVDTRGSSTMILLEAAKGQAQASCLSSASTSEAVISVGLVGGQATLVAPGQAQVTSTGMQTMNGRSLTYAEGRIGANVTGVTIVLYNGTQVSATVANGHFAAWWPGTQHAVSQRVATIKVKATRSA